MKILVTGSSGKLGRTTVHELRQQGHWVLGIDKRPSRLELGASTTDEIIDIAQPNILLPLLDGIEAICHAGTQPGIKPSSAQGSFDSSIAATFNVFDSALKAGVRKVAWASSIQAYGVVGAVHPLISSPQYLPIDENHPLWPRSPYQLSKQIGESIADAYARRCPEMQIFSLRFTWIAMPDQEISGHTDIRGSLNTYIPVQDAARAMRLCCEIDRPGHTALNIVASKPTAPWSEGELIATYGALPQFRQRLDRDAALICNARAKEILGFEDI